LTGADHHGLGLGSGLLLALAPLGGQAARLTPLGRCRGLRIAALVGGPPIGRVDNLPAFAGMLLVGLAATVDRAIGGMRRT
jgi:hypothetical protein